MYEEGNARRDLYKMAKEGSALPGFMDGVLFRRGGPETPFLCNLRHVHGAERFLLQTRQLRKCQRRLVKADLQNRAPPGGEPFGSP